MRPRSSVAVTALCGCALSVGVGCQNQRTPPVPEPIPSADARPSQGKLPPPLPPVQLSAPALAASADTQAVRQPLARPEKRMTVSTYGREADVKPLLQFIAQEGGFSLVLPIGLDKRVNVDLREVTVSQALATVLAAAGLSLAPTAGMTAPANTSVVFYQLPVNVDSLPAEAIMKRFGVSREIAEMIVRSRKP